MAIFLLIYIFFMLVWLAWSMVLTGLILKHKLPDKFGVMHLAVYWSVMAVVLIVSIIFITKADWVSVPPIFKAMAN